MFKARNWQGDNLALVLEEIEAVGGQIDRIDKKKHYKVYWSVRGRKYMIVTAASSRSSSGLRNSVSEVRRQARLAL